jgi:putative ABC transport system permease protein
MRDLRYAVRVLRRSPLFALTAIVTLALCIGANSAIYSVVDRVLLRPLPYPQPDRLAMVMTHFERQNNDEGGQTGGIWETLRDHVTTADVAVCGGTGMGVNLVAGNQPQYVQQQRVSAGFFRVLGVAPSIGREFTADEDRPGGPALAVLSHALWSRLGADPAIVGRSLMLRGESHLIVGVMPEHFTIGSAVDVWTPLRPSRRGEGSGQNYEIVARLRPAVTWPQAEAEFVAVGQAAVDDLYRDADHHARLHLVPLREGETQDVRRPLVVLWVAVGAVLLIGCVNIAGLLMARSVTRAPEIATRIALGGGRAAIVRQLLIESVVLAAAGGAAGIALGYFGAQAFGSLLGDAFDVARTDVRLDLRVFAITGAAALSTSVLFGLVPAWQATGVNLRDTLVASGSPSIAGAARSWPRRLMVMTEIALGVVLLVGAGLLIRSFAFLIGQRPGFDGTNVMTATLSMRDARYQTGQRVNQLFAQTLERMRGIAGVQHAAVALTLPYERALNNGFRWPGTDASRLMNVTYVTSEYFDVLRVPIVQGRAVTDGDSELAPAVIVVNEAFVRRYSLDRNPLGRQIQSGGAIRTIVGVVGDVPTKTSFGNFGPIAAGPAGYVPAAQTSAATFQLVHTWFSPSWFVRTAGPQAGTAAAMQRAVQAVDPLLPFAKFRTLGDVRDEAVATPRAQAVLAGTLAGLALLLAAVGLSGLVASSVAERTRELGIRMALGASTRRAIATAAFPGATMAAAGVVAGLVIARAMAQALAHLVWGVSVGDPATFALSAAAVFIVALIAALAPALRVARMDPIRALRSS